MTDNSVSASIHFQVLCLWYWKSVSSRIGNKRNLKSGFLSYKTLKRNVHTLNYKWLLICHITFILHSSWWITELRMNYSAIKMDECLVFINLQLEKSIDFQADFLYFTVILWEHVKEEIMVSSTSYLMRIMYSNLELN